MNVLNYIKLQRDRVRARHSGETFLFVDGEAMPVPEPTPVRDAYDILRDIDAMPGLNVKERAFARKRSENCYC